MAKILRPGHNSADLREPISWDPEDWSPEEWKVLCKIFGLPPGVTEGMVLHASSLEYVLCSPDRAVDYERTYTKTLRTAFWQKLRPRVATWRTSLPFRPESGRRRRQ